MTRAKRELLEVLRVAENAIISGRLVAIGLDNNSRSRGYEINRAIVNATEPGLAAIRQYRYDNQRPINGERPIRRKLLKAVGLFGYPTMVAGSWVEVRTAWNQPDYEKDGLIFLSQKGHPDILSSWTEGYVNE